MNRFILIVLIGSFLIVSPAPARDANLRLTLLTIQSIFDDITSAREAHDATRADELARQAREKIAPVLIDPEMPDVDLWVYAGRIALATGDDNLAAFAMEAIVRLDPAALDNADRAKIVALLNRRPIAEKVKSIPTERTDLMANRKKANAGDKAAALDLAEGYAKGVGIPRNISAARKLGWKGMAIDVTNSLRMDFVRIEPGTFTMGSPESEKERGNGETQHRVKLTHPFMMATHPRHPGAMAGGDADRPEPFQRRYPAGRGGLVERRRGVLQKTERNRRPALPPADGGRVGIRLPCRDDDAIQYRGDDQHRAGQLRWYIRLRRRGER